MATLGVVPSRRMLAPGGQRTLQRSTLQGRFRVQILCFIESELSPLLLASRRLPFRPSVRPSVLLLVLLVLLRLRRPAGSLRRCPSRARFMRSTIVGGGLKPSNARPVCGARPLRILLIKQHRREMRAANAAPDKAPAS